MATALKNIPFTTPAMTGEMNSSGGTTYNLADVDSIKGEGITIIEYGGSNLWRFHGCADYAGSADTAFAIGDGLGGSIGYLDISAKLGHIVEACGSFYFSGGLQNTSGATLSVDDMYNKISRISNLTIGYYFEGGLWDGGCSYLSFSTINAKLGAIVGDGTPYFKGGLQSVHSNSTLTFEDIDNKLNHISDGSATYFEGALACNGTITLDFYNNGGTHMTPVIRIGGSDYSLSVDSNGFVKATPN